MSEVLVDYVIGASTADLLALSLEDLALCQAWYASYMSVPDVREAHEGLPAKVAQWSSDTTDPSEKSLGARQQPILRHVLERLDADGVDKLTRDELDFIFFVYELIQRTKHRNHFQRPLGLIAPQMEKIRAKREILAVVRGLPTVLKQVGVATEASIQESTRREFSELGGLPLNFKGPVLRHGGSLKIIGDVPDGTAVVVEGEACFVSGYVLGNLLVRGQIEVRGNVSGTVIAQRGNIRARGVVNRATVIAKFGRIRVTTSEAPAIMYAGTQLRIDGTARQGMYVSPRIRVGGKSHGGEWHLTTQFSSGTFAPIEPGGLNIVIRRELGCEDYGEQLPREAQTLKRVAVKFRNQMEHYHQLMHVQQEEAEHYAKTALLYICSGSDSQKELQLADSLKRRRAFLIRILKGIHLLTASLTDRLKSVRDKDEGMPATSNVTAERSVQTILNEVSREVAQLKGEGEFPVEIDREWHELMELHAVSSRNDSEKTLSGAVFRFHEARNAWRKELALLDEQVGALQDNLTKDATRKRLVERARVDGTSQTALAQLIRAARERGTDDPLMRRVTTPFMKRMLTLMQKRNQWADRYRKEAGEQRAELTAVQSRLMEEFSVRPTAESAEGRVEGSFEGGSKLFVGEIHPVEIGAQRGSAFETPDSGGETWVYVTRDGEITRLAED
jgi:hypothetical protein